MKNLLLIIFCSTSLLFNAQDTTQAFGGKGSGQTSIGWSVSEINCWYKENGVGLKGRFSPVLHGLSLQHEFGLSPYAGLSVSVGVGFARNMYSNVWGNSVFGLYQNDYWSFVIPVGIQYNFHLLQWAEDRIQLGMDTQKWDGFIGFGLGGGPAFLRARNSLVTSEVGIAFFGDFQGGVRYYPNTNVGIYVQAGYGRSLLNVGIVFKK
jgi:hypothetical protein